MKQEELRELWLNSRTDPLCKMADGKIAMLIIGPSDSQVSRNDWRFGFQVHGEDDIRWREASQVSLIDGRLVEQIGPEVTKPEGLK